MEKLTISQSKIKITGCSFEKYWYKKLIGKEFYIEDYSTRDYYVIYEGAIRAILKRDAVFLNKEHPLI